MKDSESRCFGENRTLCGRKLALELCKTDMIARGGICTDSARVKGFK
jgi:hypothetical protein